MIRKNTLAAKSPSEKLRRAYEAVMIDEDGIPLETHWHRLAISLLADVIAWLYRGRRDYFAGGNMFIYYSLEQARDKKYRGPDFFFVKDAQWKPKRRWWWVLDEGGRYPDVIIELLSPGTARMDRTTKKKIYERTFRTPDYFCYDPFTNLLEGWSLGPEGRYEPLLPNDKGWLWCAELGLWLGIWEGTYQDLPARWPRFYDAEGRLLPNSAEAADAERQRADAERQRADALQAELAELKKTQRRGNGKTSS